MNQCEEMRAQMTFYLDDELQGGERAVLEAHLSDCEGCLQVFTSERRFLEMIRGVKYLHLAGPELKARVEKILSDARASEVRPKQLPSRRRRFLQQPGGPNARGQMTRRALTLTVVVVVAGIIGLWSVTQPKNIRPPNPPSEFAMMAVDTHQRHLRGQLPFEVASDVPEEISDWFAGKVPFSLK
jgi:anti-sigma factor RsiW